MFTSEELVTAFPDIYMEPFPPLEYQSYGTGSESSGDYEIVWGLKGNFRNSLHFWVAAFHRYFQECYVFPPIETFKDYDELFNSCAPMVQEELQEGRYALCNPISFSQFCLVLHSYPTKLIPGLDLKNRNGYLNSMQMKDKWNDQIILAEYSEEYLFLRWSTGA